MLQSVDIRWKIRDTVRMIVAKYQTDNQSQTEQNRTD